jgi:glycerol-3-phosphate O-acyltransferase
LVGHVLRRRLPTTEPVRFGGLAQVHEVLDRLEEHDIVTRFDEGPAPVYRISDDQYLAAAYYRNTIVHHFVNGAIAELALLRVSEAEIDDAERLFWSEVMRLRDLLKFEFFFSEKDRFVEEVADELSRYRSTWLDTLRQGPEGARELVTKLRPLRAHWALRPFLEAYLVVGDTLLREPEDRPVDDKAFLGRCLGLGKQYRLQRKIRSEEAISQVLFKSALALAANRRLTTPAPGLTTRRREFADEIRDVLRRTDVIRTLSAGRRAGLV